MLDEAYAGVQSLNLGWSCTASGRGSNQVPAEQAAGMQVGQAGAQLLAAVAKCWEALSPNCLLFSSV